MHTPAPTRSVAAASPVRSIGRIQSNVISIVCSYDFLSLRNKSSISLFTPNRFQGISFGHRKNSFLCHYHIGY